MTDKKISQLSTSVAYNNIWVPGYDLTRATGDQNVKFALTGALSGLGYPVSSFPFAPVAPQQYLPAFDPTRPAGDQNVRVAVSDFLTNQGPTGPTGPVGGPGPSGPLGPTGPQGAAGTGLKNRGAWVTGTVYAPGDYVFDAGLTSASSMWILKGTTNYTSTTQPKSDLTHWVEFSAPVGPTGPAGTGFLEAPLDGQTYGRKQATWVPALSLAGGTVTGDVTMQGIATIGTATTSAILRYLGAASNNQDMQWFVGTTGAGGLRFRQRLNTSQDMTFDAFDNAGASLGTVLSLRRLTQRGVFTNVMQASSVNASQNTVTWPGAAPPYNADQITFFSNTNTMTGVMPAGIYATNYILINNDTADATNLDGSSALRIVYGYGGHGTKGGRHGLRVDLGQEGPHDQDLRTIGAYITNTITQPTTLNGTMWAINPYIIAKTGATGYGYINGMELDLTIETGASTVNRVGMSINSSGSTDAVQGTNEDCAYSFRRNPSNTYPGWRVGFQIGSTGGAFPMDPTTGKIIYTMPMTAYAAGSPVTQYPPMVTNMGIDFFPTKFTAATFRYKGGLIDGLGNLTIGNATLNSTTNGLAIDVNYQKVTAAVVVAGASGSRCFVGDLIWHDATGVVLKVSAVNATNQATAVTIDTAGRSTTPPVNPLVFNGLNAINVQVTLTWSSTANTLSLNPSGGPTVIGGPLLLGTTAISGFGMGIGQIPIFSNRSNRPSFELNGQWIINQTAPGPTVGADVFIRHDGTGITTGAAANINKLLQLTQSVDTKDPNTNWSLLVNTNTSNTVGAKGLAAYFQMWRNAGSNAWVWGQVTEVTDFTGSKSSVVNSPTLTQEWDLTTSDLDDAPNPGKFGGIGNRHLIHAVIGRQQGTALNEVTTGIWFGTGNASYFDSVIGFEISGGGSFVRQVLDTRGAKPPTGVTDPVAAVRMSNEQIIDFYGGTKLDSAPGNYLQYTIAAPRRLHYVVGGNEQWSIGDTGAMAIAGTTTIGTDTTAAFLVVKGPAASQRRVQWQTAGLARWAIYANPTAESTADIGSDLDLTGFNDLGASKGVVMRVTRATGAMTIDPAGVYAAGATFTGSIAGTLMTVTAIASGTIVAGQTIGGAGLVGNVIISSLGTGTGGIGTYNINVARTIPSQTIQSITPSLFTSNLPARFNRWIWLRGNYALNGGTASAPNSNFWTDQTISGTMDGTGTGSFDINRLNATDTATCVGGYTGRNYVSIHYSSGAGAAGAAVPLSVRGGDAGTGTDRAAGGQYQGFAGAFTTECSFNQGGTSATDCSGAVWGLNVVSQLKKGATFYNALRNMELNFGIDTGASAINKTVIKMTQSSDNVNSYNDDQFILMGRGASSTANLAQAILCGGRGDVGWSWGTKSVLYSADGWGNDTPTNGGTHPLACTISSWTADHSVAFARAYGPFGPLLLDGTGCQIGPLRIVPSASGTSIDSAGSYGTGTPTVAAGGTGYVVGDRLFYGNGGVCQVATIGTAGDVLTVRAPLRQPYLIDRTTPTNPLATTRDWQTSAGTGCTLNVTWNVTANQLTLNASAGAFTCNSSNSTFNGTVNVGSNTTSQVFVLNGASAQTKQIQWRTANSLRWQLRADPAAETGGDAGSDLILQAASDTGAGKGSLLIFDRLYGAQQFNPYAVTFTGNDTGTPGLTMTYSMKSSYSGLTSAAGGIIFNRWWVTGDTTTDNSQGVYHSYLADYGPATTGGGRTCLQAFVRTAGNITLQPGGACALNGFRAQAQAIHDGGQTSALSGGGVQGMDVVAEMVDSATGWSGPTVIQANLSVSGVGNNNMIHRVGLFLGMGADPGTQAGRNDSLISTSLGSFASRPVSYPAPGMGFRYYLGIGNGGNSAFPLDMYNGEIIGSNPPIVSPPGATAMPPQACLHGINLSKINFAESAWWSPGVKIAGNGTTRISRLQISAGTNGPAIDAPLQIAAISSIKSSTSGVNIPLNVGEQVYDHLGGIAIIDTVDANHSVTAAHYLYPPCVAAGDIITVASGVVAAQANSGSTTIHLRAGTYGIAIGDTVTAKLVTGIPAGATVTAFTTSQADATVTLSVALTANLLAGSMLVFTQTMPSTTVTFRTGSKGSFVANVTWTAASEVAMGSANVDVRIGKGSAAATTDTKGHLLIPFCAGTPTGVPTNAAEGIAVRYDTTNHKLWAYDSGTSTWKGVVLT